MAYLKNAGLKPGDRSLASVNYLSAIRDWGAEQQLPLTHSTQSLCSGYRAAGNGLPLTIDANGDATMLATSCTGRNLQNQRVTSGLRYEGGRWLRPVALTTDSQFFTMASVSHAAVDANGVFVGVLILADATQQPRATAARSVPGTGRSLSDIQPWAYYAAPSVAWLGSTGEAVTLQIQPGISAMLGMVCGPQARCRRALRKRPTPWLAARRTAAFWHSSAATRQSAFRPVG